MSDMQAGATLDLGSLHLEIGKIGDHLSALDKSIRDLRRKIPNIPRVLSGESSIAGAGTYFVDVGTPPQGSVYNVVSLSISGGGTNPDYSPVPNLTGATAYISASDDQSISPEILVPAFGTTTAPGLQTWGRETIWVFPGEKILVTVVASGASSATVVARVLQYAIADMQPRII